MRAPTVVDHGGSLSWVVTRLLASAAATRQQAALQVVGVITAMNRTVPPIRWRSGSAMTEICAESTQ
jgi:hypothetical protein